MNNHSKINAPVKTDKTEFVPLESRRAWEIWKKLTDFSEWLWDEYEKDFMTLAASEPPKCFSGDGLPF